MPGLSPEIDLDAPEAPPGTLLLPGRKFPLDYAQAGVAIGARVLRIAEVANSGAGTANNIWDGAYVLAKLLELCAAEGDAAVVAVRGARVLELGSGTGLVGLAAAAAGAAAVVLTDLPYALPLLTANVQHNVEATAGAQVHVAALDWTRPLPPLPAAVSPPTLIVAADVVWVPELIQPLVRTLAALCAAGAPPPPVLLSHQTRARASDALLFAALRAQGFAAREVPRERHHPEARDDDIQVWLITREEAKMKEGGEL